jgi:hypothetical protein
MADCVSHRVRPSYHRRLQPAFLGAYSLAFAAVPLPRQKTIAATTMTPIVAQSMICHVARLKINRGKWIKQGGQNTENPCPCYALHLKCGNSRIRKRGTADPPQQCIEIVSLTAITVRVAVGSQTPEVSVVACTVATQMYRWRTCNDPCGREGNLSTRCFEKAWRLVKPLDK